MAEGQSICSGGLQTHCKISQNRDLLSYNANATRGNFHSCKHIAEGFKKRGVSDKTRFLNIAQGSLEESRYYLLLTADLEYGATGDMEILLEEVSKLLVAYASAIESKR